MSEEAIQRESICRLSKSLHDRGLTGGTSGNISVCLSDGRLLVSPTNSCLGALDPARLSLCSLDGSLISGDNPTKEIPLHVAFYETRGTKTGAVIHLHSTYAVALSMLPDVDQDNLLPPLTAYSIMRLGKVKLLPFFMPGDPGIGNAIRDLAGKRSAVVLANHGPVVAGKDLETAIYAIEELEETAKLALLVRKYNPNLLTDAQIRDVIDKFEVDWD